MLALLPGPDGPLIDQANTPGLAALKPGSPLMQLLAREGRPSHSPLSVVAGATRGDSVGKWFKGLLSSTALTAGDGDLVVPLVSALAGLERVPPAVALVDEGSQVSHFKYFRNERTRAAILAALLADGELPEGFSDLARWRQRTKVK